MTNAQKRDALSEALCTLRTELAQSDNLSAASLAGDMSRALNTLLDSHAARLFDLIQAQA